MRGTYKAATVVIALLTLVVAEEQLNLMREATKPGVPQLDGGFNILVAQTTFPSNSRTDETISDHLRRVAARITRHPQLAARGFSVDIAGPSGVPAVEGATAAERGGSARLLARSFGADLVVYATPEPSLNRMVIGLTLTDRTLLNSEELAGSYEWLSSVTADDAATNLLAGGSLATDAGNAARGVINLVIGLAYRDAGEDARALSRFLAAKASTPMPAFRSMVDVFVGNAALSLGRVRMASRHFEEALRVADDALPRALLGSAEVMFLQSRGDCVRSEQEMRLLETAHQRYESVITVPQVDPATRVRALFGSARTLLCLASGSDRADWEDAETRFAAVVAQYEGGSRELQRATFRVAAESYAGLGLIDLLRRDPTSGFDETWEGARWNYEKAISITRYWAPADERRISLFESIVTFIQQNENPAGERAGETGFDVAGKGIVLPPSLVKRQISIDIGGDGGPCGDEDETTEPIIEFASAAMQTTRTVELGNSVSFCFRGFSSGQPLDVELLPPGEETPELVTNAGTGDWTNTFLPPDPLGTYELRVEQRWLQAHLAFEVVPASSARVVLGDRLGSQDLHLLGFPRSSVAFVNLHREVYSGRRDGLGDYKARYTSSFPVPIDEHGNALYPFPDRGLSCTTFRISTIPVNDATLHNALAPQLCL